MIRYGEEVCDEGIGARCSGVFGTMGLVVFAGKSAANFPELALVVSCSGDGGSG